MILRKPTKIVLKMEHDMIEYDEFKRNQEGRKRNQSFKLSSQAYLTPNNRKADFQPNLAWSNDFSDSNHDIFNRHEISDSRYHPQSGEDINHLLNNINPDDE